MEWQFEKTNFILNIVPPFKKVTAVTGVTGNAVYIKIIVITVTGVT